MPSKRCAALQAAATSKGHKTAGFRIADDTADTLLFDKKFLSNCQRGLSYACNQRNDKTSNYIPIIRDYVYTKYKFSQQWWSQGLLVMVVLHVAGL